MNRFSIMTGLAIFVDGFGVNSSYASEVTEIDKTSSFCQPKLTGAFKHFPEIDKALSLIGSDFHQKFTSTDPHHLEDSDYLENRKRALSKWQAQTGDKQELKLATEFAQLEVENYSKRLDQGQEALKSFPSITMLLSSLLNEHQVASSTIIDISTRYMQFGEQEVKSPDFRLNAQSFVHAVQKIDMDPSKATKASEKLATLFKILEPTYMTHPLYQKEEIIRRTMGIGFRRMGNIDIAIQAVAHKYPGQENQLSLIQTVLKDIDEDMERQRLEAETKAVTVSLHKYKVNQAADLLRSFIEKIYNRKVVYNRSKQEWTPHD